MGANTGKLKPGLTWPATDLRGKVAIVTGASSGIGLETAKHLALMGARVILACRSDKRGQAAILRIQAALLETKEGHQLPYEPVEEVSVEFMKLDLQSLKSVVKFAAHFKAKGLALHILVCNAGIALVEQGQTEDGFELQFQTNYLGHFLLTLHLLPVMRKSGPDVRIVNVSSLAHTQGVLDLANIQAQRSYNRMGFYGNSKLFQIMNTIALQRRLESTGISVFSLHPGNIKNTGTTKDLDGSLWDKMVNPGGLYSYLSSDVTLASTSTLNCAVNPMLSKLSGSYFVNCIPRISSTESREEKSQEILWNYSLECLERYLTKDLVHDLVYELDME